MNSKQLFKVIKNRRSIREFKAKPVSETLIRTLIDAARYAPSNNNRQAWKFLVITSSGLKHKMAYAIRNQWQKKVSGLNDIQPEARQYGNNFNFFVSAPAVIAVLYKKIPLVAEQIIGRKSGNKERFSGEIISASMAAQNLLLMAYALGLGACPMSGPLIAEALLKKIVKMPSSYNICCLIPVGWPKKPPRAPVRKDIDEIIEFVRK